MRDTIACPLHGPYHGDDCQGCIAVSYLGRLGKVDHPDTDRRPVHALGQVAVDLQQTLNLSPKRTCLGSCGALEARRQAFAAARAAVLQEFQLDEALAGDGRPARGILRVAVESALDRAEARPPGPPDPPPAPPGRKVA